MPEMLAADALGFGIDGLVGILSNHLVPGLTSGIEKIGKSFAIREQVVVESRRLD